MDDDDIKEILKEIQWKGPPFSVTIQNNEDNGKYVYTDTQKKFILKIENMEHADETEDNERRVLETLLNNPKDNLPKPLKLHTSEDDMNIAIMVNSGVSLNGTTFEDYTNKKPSANDFFMATKSLINSVQNLHSLGFIHRDITPGNVVYNKNTNEWTLIDFDFTVPFSYKRMGSEVIVNEKYDYVIHPWITLDEEQYMNFDVDRLKKYMDGIDIKWYMLIDYYAIIKVILHTFNLLLSNNESYPHVLKDKKVMECIIRANFSNKNSTIKQIIATMYSIIGSFEKGSDLPNATIGWDKLLTLTKITAKRNKKRIRNDSHKIKGSGVGKLKKVKRGVKTFSLI